MNLKPKLKEIGGQGVHREVESEGHEEKYRAVINGGYPDDEPVGQRWGSGRACTMKAKAFSFVPPYQGVCGRHDTEEQRVTSGELTESMGGTVENGPISESEKASDARSVVGRPEYYRRSAVKAARPG
jgi:hypothetical protein